MSKKPQLSKNLLQMKFMQRRKNDEAVEDAAEVDPKKAKTTKRRSPTSKTLYRREDSYLALEDLQFGRMSFQGFNPEVERWMKHFAALREESKAANVKKGMKKDVTDEEAANRLTSVSKTIGRLFTKKRHRQDHDSDEDVEVDESVVIQTKTKKRFKRPADE